MKSNLDVAVIGGGIAGLATSIALRRIGMSVNVYESRSQVHNIGAGVVCWPNATFVLAELGVLDELKSVAGNVSHMRRYSANGNELGNLDIRLLDAAMGFPSLAVLRSDLMEILLNAAKRTGVSFYFDRCATEIQKEDGNTRILFADGTSTNADFIIGADGRMNSVARRYVIGNNQPVFQGFVNWIGIVDLDFAIPDEHVIGDYWGVGSRFGIVPVSPRRAYWAGGLATDDPMNSDGNENISTLRQTFQGWPSPIGNIVSNATNANTKRLNLYDHNPTPVWHNDNVFMIGDAAHAALPTSGQGAAQALEDAWMLAKAFANFYGDLETVFSSVTKARFEKTSAIIAGGRAFARSLFNTDPVACSKRDHDAMKIDYRSMSSGMVAGWSSGLPL